MSEIPWVIQGEQGPSTLTYWQDNEPIGFRSVCATCGWKGKVRVFVSGENDHQQWTDACDDGAGHIKETGHVYREEGETVVPQIRYHIWRYDATTPTEEHPWILTTIINDDATEDPPCFATFGEAVDALPARDRVIRDILASGAEDELWPSRFVK